MVRQPDGHFTAIGPAIGHKHQSDAWLHLASGGSKIEDFLALFASHSAPPIEPLLTASFTMDGLEDPALIHQLDYSQEESAAHDPFVTALSAALFVASKLQGHARGRFTAYILHKVQVLVYIANCKLVRLGNKCMITATL